MYVSHDLLAHISSLYSLKTITSIIKIQEGYLTENYKLVTEDNHEYFLKQHRHSTKEALLPVINSEQIFDQPGIPIIKSLKNTDNQYFFVFNSIYFTLYPFVAGEPSLRTDLTIQQTTSMGEMLAKMHLIGQKADHSLYYNRNVDLKKAKFEARYPLIRAALEKTPAKSKFDEIAYTTLSLKHRLHEIIPYFSENISLKNDSIIHGDFHDKNMFFNENGGITAIFDLEKTEYAPKLFELIRSIDYSCFFTGINDNTYTLAEHFIRSYNAVLPINITDYTQTLKAYLISKINNLWLENEHYINNNDRIGDLLPQELVTLKYLETNYEEFIERMITYS